jgi:hypothetical protein
MSLDALAEEEKGRRPSIFSNHLAKETVSVHQIKVCTDPAANLAFAFLWLNEMEMVFDS